MSRSQRIIGTAAIVLMTTTVKTFPELSAQEFFRICEVREQVFVLEQKITLCAELDEQDLHSTHITVTEDDKIVAYARCYAEDGIAHIGRVLTIVRGKGYGLEPLPTAGRFWATPTSSSTRRCRSSAFTKNWASA